MTLSGSDGEASNPTAPEKTVRRLHFVPGSGGGSDVLMTFPDPLPHQAIWDSSGTETPSAPGTLLEEGIEILMVSGQSGDPLGGNEDLFQWVAATAPPGILPAVITLHGAQVVWGTSRAALQAAPDRLDAFLLTLVEFCYFEAQLRKLEHEVADSWPQLEQDTATAHDVDAPDPEHYEDLGRRTDQVLKRRIRLARLSPHLYQPRPRRSPLAHQLMERLREKAHAEERIEALGSQMDVFERIYEMNSQRISDAKLSKKERTLEWVIIILLATETLLLLIDLLWTLEI